MIITIISIGAFLTGLFIFPGVLLAFQGVMSIEWTSAITITPMTLGSIIAITIGTVERLYSKVCGDTDVVDLDEDGAGFLFVCICFGAFLGLIFSFILLFLFFS